MINNYIILYILLYHVIIMLLDKSESGWDERSWTKQPMWYKKFQKEGAVHWLPGSRECFIIRGKSNT